MSSWLSTSLGFPMLGWREFWSLGRDSIVAWNEDYAASMGAAIAFYTLFSIAPLLVIAIAVAGIFFGEEAARGGIFLQVQSLLGQEGAHAIEGLVKSAGQPAKGFVAILTSVGAILIGATAVFGELQNALDRIWQAPLPKRGGMTEFIHSRLLTFSMVLGVAFVLMVSLVISAVISALGTFWTAHVGGWESVLQLINLGLSVIVFTILFALIYRFVPRASVAWEDVWIGAVVTAVLFTIGKFFIGLYLGKSSVTSVFGAAGSLVTVLIWVYYSAQIFLLGAEFTWAYARKYGSRSHRNGTGGGHRTKKPVAPNNHQGTASMIGQTSSK